MKEEFKMALVTTKELLLDAQKNGYAVGAFNVENMECMFAGSEFNGDISNWDVSRVENMGCMFEGSKFDGDISNWDISNVKDADCMFDDSPLEGNEPDWY